jgi:hypothetical protein
MQSSTLLQISAERLDQNTIQYKESPGVMMQATKKIASMWMEMAQLIRSQMNLKDCILYS